MSQTSRRLLTVLIFASPPTLGLAGEPAKPAAVSLDADLVAHWPLTHHGGDRSAGRHHAVVRGNLDFSGPGRAGGRSTAARFDGRGSRLEVPPGVAKRLTGGEFSWALWVNVGTQQRDVPGDLVCMYDPALRRGFQLALKTNAGVASAQSNDRHLHFGIDNDRQTDWQDHGRPGNAILAFAMTVHDGQLYAGTCEPGENESGRVYRHGGEQRWIDCGAPARCNAVTSLAVYDGALYAGVGKYRLAGSSLDESTNPHSGGRVFRYEGEDRWTDCGQLPDVEAVGGMVVFGGKLYASSLYQPAGFFRYEGKDQWTDCGTPGKRVEALGVYNGHLYATSYDGGFVFRFDGDQWTDCGQLGAPGENTQTYSLAVYQGRLFVGTWPSGRVYRFEDVGRWTDVGRLGEELEVMGMLVHNGRLLAGTLPLAEVYEYRGGDTWQRLARLDRTPEVRYRRAWTMAEHDGRVFCSTLPSGHVFAWEAGVNAMSGRALPSGWRHVAAVKGADRLRLYVDGEQVAESRPFAPAEFELASEAPLWIGFGQNDYFSGSMTDVRCYARALSPAEIAALAESR